MTPEYPGCKLNCQTDSSVCGEIGDCNFKSVYRNLINRRVNTINKRCQYYDVDPITKESVNELFMEAINKNLRCRYCGEIMSLTTSRTNYRMAISIDHRIPLAAGGTNAPGNLTVCCTRCNLVKGTMDEKYFIFILNSIHKEMGRDDMLNWLESAYCYAQAYKIMRNRSETTYQKSP